MSDTDGYNGSANRATWAFTLWTDNEQGSYARALELAEEYAGETPEDDDTVGLADALEAEARRVLDPEEYVENFGDVKLSEWVNGPGKMARDVGDLDEVNWREAAASYLRTYRENNA